MESDRGTRKTIKVFTPQLEDRLYQTLFDVTESLLDLRDKVLDIYKALDDFEGTNRGKSYCLRLLRELDNPIRCIRREVCAEKDVVILPKASRVKREIVELMKTYKF